MCHQQSHESRGISHALVEQFSGGFSSSRGLDCFDVTQQRVWSCLFRMIKLLPSSFRQYLRQLACQCAAADLRESHILASLSLRAYAMQGIWTRSCDCEMQEPCRRINIYTTYSQHSG